MRAGGDVGVKGGVGGDNGMRACDTPSARATAPLPEGVRVASNVGLKGGGGDNNGRIACDAVVRERHGAPPGGGEGRW